MKSEEKYNQICDAVQQGYLERVQKIYASFPKDEFDFSHLYYNGNLNGNILLEVAVLNNHKDIVDFLIKEGADYQTGTYEPLIIKAARAGHTDMVQYFLDLGVDANTTGKDFGNTEGWPVVYEAIFAGKVDVVRCLQKNGVDIKNPKQPQKFDIFPLLIAVTGNNPEMVEYLLNQGVDIEQKSANGDTVLITAIDNNSWPIVKLLIAYGADIEAQNNFARTASELIQRRTDTCVQNWWREFEQNPEKFRMTPEQRIMRMSADELVDLPHTNAKLMKEVEKLDLFACIVEVLSYDNQKKFYKETNHQMKPETKKTVEHIIRNNRE